MPSKRKRNKLRVRRQLSDAQLNARLVRARGESHPRAKLTDHEVDLVLELRAHGFTLRELSDKFETPKSTIADICRGFTRVKYG